MLQALGWAVPVAVLMAWVELGRRRLAGTRLAPLERRMRLAARAALAVCLPLGPLAALGLVPPLAAGLGASFGFVLFQALEPRRAGFWHHRRVRALGLAAAAGVGALAGFGVMPAETLPSLAGVAIFHEFLRGWAAALVQGEEDLLGLRERIVRLETERHNAAVERRAG